MKFLTLTLSVLLLALCSSAQIVRNYKWDDKVNLDSLITEDVKKEEDVILIDRAVVEFYYSTANKLVEYYYVHRMNFVNSEDAVDGNNKVYLSVDEDEELVTYNARVISPNGDIKELGSDALEVGTDENDNTYKYFAIEGAEVGGIIEYYYMKKSDPTLNGAYYNRQYSTPVQYSAFTVIAPTNLTFEFKSLNGYPEMVLDTNLPERWRWSADTTDIAKLEPGAFVNANGNRMQLIYELYSNTNSYKKDFYNYGTVSQSYFEFINKELEGKIGKRLEKLHKTIGTKSAVDTEDKILKIEDYVKTNFSYVKNGSSKLSDIEFILDNKVANESGMTRLLFNLFKLEGINKQIVLTSDRNSLRFHPTYESYVFLNDMMLYFPEIDKYLAPASALMRLGVVPSGNVNTYALFIKKVSAGDVVLGAGEVKYVDAPPAEHTKQMMDIDVSFNLEEDSVVVQMKQTYTGYYALSLQPIVSYIEEDKMEEFEKSIVEGIQEELVVSSVELKNGGTENYMRLPFEVDSKYKSKFLLDKAGNKLLFKAGLLIGPQAEMYAEEEKEEPVENDFNRKYLRKITIEIPEGYSCQNPEALNMDVQPFKSDGNKTYFTSTYTVDGNKIEVIVNEVYDQIEYPKERYQDYRKVINAAADFNKIILVFNKKN